MPPWKAVVVPLSVGLYETGSPESDSGLGADVGELAPRWLNDKRS